MNGLIKVNLLENICYELRKSLAFEWIDCIDIDTLCVSDRETAVDSREKHTHTHTQAARVAATKTAAAAQQPI